MAKKASRSKGVRPVRSARWTVSSDEFRRFCEADVRIAAETRHANFYEPPSTIPAEGMEVMFADDGVLIGEGYFTLSISHGRCVYSVRSIASGVPMIEFETVLTTKVRTSSASIGTARTRERLRVPVAANATSGANNVVRKFDVALA